MNEINNTRINNNNNLAKDFISFFIEQKKNEFEKINNHMKFFSLQFSYLEKKNIEKKYQMLLNIEKLSNNENTIKMFSLFLKLSNIKSKNDYNGKIIHIDTVYYLNQILNTAYSIAEVENIINLLKEFEPDSSKKVWRPQIIINLNNLDNKIKSIIRDYCFVFENKLRSNIFKLTYDDKYLNILYKILNKNFYKKALKKTNLINKENKIERKNIQNAISKLTFNKLIEIMKEIGEYDESIFIIFTDWLHGCDKSNLNKNINVSMLKKIFSTWKNLRNIVSHEESFFIEKNRLILKDSILLMYKLADKTPDSESNKFILKFKKDYNSKILKKATELNIPVEIVNLFIL